MCIRKILIILSAVCISLHANAEGYWVNNTWDSDFHKGLWEGCIDKTLISSGYFKENGNITGEELRTSQDPLLLTIKRACNCQTEYFQNNYTSDKLKSILVLQPEREEYQSLMAGVYEACK